jgi:hypothetical protein
MAMGMALGRGKRDNFDVTYAAWSDILELAEQYGWQPIGTGPPRWAKKDEWSGSYYSSDGQRFYARDAAALADALERFLAGDPAVRRRSPRREDRERLRGLIGGLSRELGVPLNLPDGGEQEWWPATQWGHDFLRRFVAFCRRGAFWLG